METTGSYKVTDRAPEHHYGLFPSRKTARTIGIVYPSYGYSRCSYGLPVRQYTYRRVRAWPIHRLLNTSFWKMTPVVMDRSIPLLHTWNALPANRDFVVSYELELPRYFEGTRAWQRRKGLDILRSDRCKRLLALTATAARLRREAFTARGLEDVAAKITVFRGGVSIPEQYVKTYDRPRYPDRPLKAMFVGGAGYRKGIVPCLRALRAARDAGLEIEFTVISELKHDYLPQPLSSDAEETKRLLAESDWIDYHPSLPNTGVLEKMGQADMLFLPTLDDAQGWTPIEAGLIGLPRVTTNVMAQPECVHHRETGWIIDLDVEDARWVGASADDQQFAAHLDEAYRRVERGIAAMLEEVTREPDLLRSWGQAARERLADVYDPHKAAAQIEAIYAESLAS